MAHNQGVNSMEYRITLFMYGRELPGSPISLETLVRTLEVFEENDVRGFRIDPAPNLEETK